MQAPSNNPPDALGVYLEPEESIVHQIAEVLQKLGITLVLESASDQLGSEFIDLLEVVDSWLIFIGASGSDPWKKVYPSFEKFGNPQRPQPLGIVLPGADFDLLPPILKSHLLFDLTKGPDDWQRIEELAETIHARHQGASSPGNEEPAESPVTKGPPPPGRAEKKSGRKAVPEDAAAPEDPANPEPTRPAPPEVDPAVAPETEPQPAANSQAPPREAQEAPARKGLLTAMVTGFTGAFARSFKREIRRIKEGRASPRRSRLSSGEMTLISAKAAALLTGLAAVSAGIHSARQEHQVQQAVEVEPAPNSGPSPAMTEQRQAIADGVARLVVAQLGVPADQVTDNANLIRDLGADSLDVVELIMALEKEFALKIPEAEAEKLTTVGSIIDYLATRVGAAKAFESPEAQLPRLPSLAFVKKATWALSPALSSSTRPPRRIGPGNAWPVFRL